MCASLYKLLNDFLGALPSRLSILALDQLPLSIGVISKQHLAIAGVVNGNSDILPFHDFNGAAFLARFWALQSRNHSPDCYRFVTFGQSQ
jgi:hypothetical protein